MVVMHALLETWDINARINLFLLDAIPEAAIDAPLTKGKAVRAHFVHVHAVRLMWLKASAPDLHATQTKLDAGALRDEIASGLTSSGAAIRELVARAQTPEGRIKGFKPHAAAFVAYLVAHESFHRAQIELALRQAGTPLPDKVAYALWEWGVR